MRFLINLNPCITDRQQLWGAAQTAARQRGLEGVQLSISYGDDAVIAVALGLMSGAS